MSAGGRLSASQQQQPYSTTGGGATNNSTVGERNNREKVEDCRDYLRTGRCKYGASCKYSHPPNVQSGGGMKTPLNPTEPMFPIRPDQPICRYYIKHGTCKFGQACKFHHPPTAQQQPHYAPSSPTASPVLLSVGPGRKIVEPATQLVAVGPPGADLTHMMVQFLPQRPEEPDCIYFLKNGRCKYGATCRYHHPIRPYTTQPTPPRQTRHPRNPHSDLYAASAPKRIPYATQQVGPAHPPRHIVVASEGGGPVSFVGLDQTGAIPASYKPVTFVSAGGEILSTQSIPHGLVNGGSAVYSGSTVMTEQGSSASSIASSFDTANSSLDVVGNDAAAAAYWSRARKNGSGGSLNAFDKARGPGNNMSSGSSDGNAARCAHSFSLGRASDYYRCVEILPSQGTQPPEFDRQTRRSGRYSNEMLSENSGHVVSSVQPSAGRPPIASCSGRQEQSRRPDGDEGFTMMTSALLNMLDTQEETSAEAYSEEEGSFNAGSRPVPPADDVHLSGSKYAGHEDVVPSGMMEELTLYPTNRVVCAEDAYPRPTDGMAERRSSVARWSPTTNAKLHVVHATPPPREHHPNSHHPPPANGGRYGGQSTDFGLYLL